MKNSTYSMMIGLLLTIGVFTVPDKLSPVMFISVIISYCSALIILTLEGIGEIKHEQDRNNK